MNNIRVDMRGGERSLEKPLMSPEEESARRDVTHQKPRDNGV